MRESGWTVCQLSIHWDTAGSPLRPLYPRWAPCLCQTWSWAYLSPHQLQTPCLPPLSSTSHLCLGTGRRVEEWTGAGRGDSILKCSSQEQQRDTIWTKCVPWLKCFHMCFTWNCVLYYWCSCTECHRSELVNFWKICYNEKWKLVWWHPQSPDSLCSFAHWSVVCFKSCSIKKKIKKIQDG